MIKISSYTPVDPSKTIPNSRPEWAKSIPVFRPKRRKKTLAIWVEHTYMASIREYPPPPPPQLLQNKDSETVVVGRLGTERYKHS